jgi:Periplasmic binding protein
MCNTPVEVQFTSAGCLNYPCRTPVRASSAVGGSADAGEEGQRGRQATSCRTDRARRLGICPATTHYLKAVEAAGTDETQAVMERMRSTPINDFFVKNGKIREDGRMVYEMYLYEIKKPAESYYKLVATIPEDQAFQPLSESKCPLVRKGSRRRAAADFARLIQKLKDPDSSCVNSSGTCIAKLNTAPALRPSDPDRVNTKPATLNDVPRTGRTRS